MCTMRKSGAGRPSRSWQDRHLHAFFICEGDRQVTEIASEADGWDDGDERVLLGRTTRLSDYIPGYKQIVYVYDFGDDWQHEINVGNVIEGYQFPFPTCVSGVGE